MPSLPYGWKPNMKTSDPFFTPPTQGKRLNLDTLQDRLCLVTLPPATRAAREAEEIHTLELHLNTIPSLHGSLVVTTLDDRWVLEMLMQMIDILKDTELSTDTDIVNGTQMLSVLWESHTTRMGHDGNVELLSHEEHGEDFIHATHAAGVNLADVNGAGGEELLEDHAVLAHFSGGDADSVRAECVTNGFVAENVVWRSGLLDEPWLELFEVLHVFDGFWDGPDL